MKTKDRTTDLQELEKGTSFTWGLFIQIYKVGEYVIVEYFPHEFKDGFSTGNIDYSKKHYSCYINGKDICMSEDSLDSALATCIAYKYDGRNSRAASYFMKMIKPEGKD